MSNSNLIKVYGQGHTKYGHRQRYVDIHGKSFTGTHTEAKIYYSQLYPTMSITVSDYPRKREKR